METSLTEEKIFQLKILIQRAEDKYEANLNKMTLKEDVDLSVYIQVLKNELARERSKLNGT